MIKFLYVFIIGGLLSASPASCQNQSTKKENDKETTVASAETKETPENKEDKAGPKDKFPSVLVYDLNNKEVDLKDLATNGKTTVLSFWANWCGPCKRELNSYNKLYKKWESDYNVQFYAVSMDDKKTAKNLKNIVDGYSWTFPILWDGNKEGLDKFNITGIPYMLIIDKNGNIVKKQTGYDPADEGKLEQMLKDLK
jgi:cytochrome c biogenesis protein CcmG, thiol:disulfide interchange protein DsbE